MVFIETEEVHVSKKMCGFEKHSVKSFAQFEGKAAEQFNINECDFCVSLFLFTFFMHIIECKNVQKSEKCVP